MKKRILFIATAVACMFAFTACEGDSNQLQQLQQQFAGADLLGHINLQPSDPQDGAMFAANHPSVLVDTMKFKSALCNANFTYDGEYVDSTVTVDAGALFFGSYTDIIAEGTVDIQFPMVGINLRDTMPGDYAISVPTGDFSFIEDLNEHNWSYYLTNNDIQYGNMMVVAVGEDDYYICYQGNIHIDEFSSVGTIVRGSVQNVKAFYVTRQQLQLLLAIPDAGRQALTYYLPRITFNGEIASRRANIQQIVDELEEME